MLASTTPVQYCAPPNLTHLCDQTMIRLPMSAVPRPMKRTKREKDCTGSIQTPLVLDLKDERPLTFQSGGPENINFSASISINSTAKFPGILLPASSALVAALETV